MKVQAEICAMAGLFEALVRLQPAPAIDSRRNRVLVVAGSARHGAEDARM